MFSAAQSNAVAARENFVTTFLFVPLGQRGRHVHFLNDVAPAYTCVVRAERYFAFLRGVRNDALFSAAEVIIQQILEPHSRAEQEVPAIRAALFDVLQSGLAIDFAVITTSCAK